VVIRPSTLLRFHEYLVRRKYRALFSAHGRGKPGPKGPSQELILAIVELKRRNRRFGYPHIARIISKTFGLEIDRKVVRRVLAKHYHPDDDGNGPSWLTFLGHMKDSLWSIDFFRCESITHKSHWVMVVMDQFTRRIIGFAVHPGDVNGTTLCRMFNQVIAGKSLPRYLSSDNDPLFEYHRWQANLRILEVDEIKTARGIPVSHPFVERLIGTIRREFLDQVLFWNTLDLERKLSEFQYYYNQKRVHASLGGDTPAEVAGEPETQCAKINDFRWQTHCRGLVQLPIAA
jgi:transposase InsO family protein